MVQEQIGIHEGYLALEREDYETALRCFTSFLGHSSESPMTRYNAHFGIALCFFYFYSQTPSQKEFLEDALKHAESAAEIYEKRYDLQLLLGQCYATKYTQTGDAVLQQKARDAYNASKTHAALFSDDIRHDLGERIAVLLIELEGN